MKTKLVVLISCFIASTKLFSGNMYVGTSGATFLKIGVAAKAVSLGEAFVSLANDASAAYYNPAGIGYFQNKNVGFTYNLWFQNISHQYVNIAIPVNEKVGSFGLSAIWLTTDKIDAYDKYNNAVGDFDAQDQAYILTYSRLLKDSLSIGLSVKYIQQRIEKITSEPAYGVDIGAIYRLNKIRIGGVVRNIGSEVKFVSKSDPLPLLVQVGVSKTFFENNSLVVATDLSLPRDNDPRFHLGVEYFPWQIFALRVGYKSGSEFGAIYGLSAGVGLNWRFMNFDISFTPFSVLGNSYRVSLSLKFWIKIDRIYRI